MADDSVDFEEKDEKPKASVKVKKKAPAPQKESVPAGSGGTYRVDKDGVRHLVDAGTQGG